MTTDFVSTVSQSLAITMLKELMISLSIGSLLLALGINLQTSKKRTVVLVRNELIALMNKIFYTRACPPLLLTDVRRVQSGLREQGGSQGCPHIHKIRKGGRQGGLCSAHLPSPQHALLDDHRHR